MPTQDIKGTCKEPGLMMPTPPELRNLAKTRRLSLMLVSIMLGSIILSMAPAAASRAKTYHVQRDPMDVASGDLDCDGDNDLVTASDMGMFISILYNDNGDFSDREDVWVVNNQSRRAGFYDIADASAVEIGDIDGDGNPDIVYFQANIRVVGGGVVMGNLTILYGDCAGGWTKDGPITVEPYMIDIKVADVNGDGDDDIVGLFIDSTVVNMKLAVFHGPDPTSQANQATTTMPLGGTTGHYYYALQLGEYGESSQVAPPPNTGTCDDIDAWMMTAPAYNGPAGFDAGNWDNVTVIEYDCLTNRFFDPTTSPANTHVFAMGTPNDGQFDIADTDNDGTIDFVAMVDGWDQNVTYAERNGNNWVTGAKADIGEFVGASVAINDVNQDGHVDFVVPTMLTVTSVTSTGLGNQTVLSTDNLVDLNTVNIILSDGSGGWMPPQSFDIGRRPTIVIVDQLSGGSGSALDLAVGQRDYSFTYSDGSMFIDSKGWAGAMDTLNIIQLDSQDVGIAGLSVYPAAWNPATRQATLGEGQRDVNVTIKNTGLETISGQVNVDLSAREVIGGSDTIVYANDFDGNVNNANCAQCALGGVSYTQEWANSPDGTSWHIEQNNASASPNAWETDTNPTGYYWAGTRHANSSSGGAMETGYYNNQDEALILSNVDLSGTDAAFLDIDLMCAVGYSVVYYSSSGIANRIVYDDSCSVDVWSEANGWETTDYFGGYDNDRYLHLASGFYPEQTVNNNLYYRGTLYTWLNLTGDNAIDLTPWAGDTVDIRFRFRTGFDGTVGTDDETNQTQYDGYAIDNLSIRKTVTQFGATPQSTQSQLTLTNLQPGEEEVVTLPVNFVNNTTYMIEAEIASTSGFTNGDDTNDDTRFRTTVENLFDPAVDEITSFNKGQLYAAETYPIDVRVANRGNTVTDFDVRATISSATPNLLLSEDFEPRQTAPLYGDDGDPYGKVIDDTASSVQNSIVPGNRPVFGSAAYWFGGPDDGYGDEWNESMTLSAIDLTQMNADFAYLTFDYFAETNVLWQGDDLVAVTEYAALEVSWRNGSSVYTGRIYGNWNDYNENGIRPNQTCEDIDDNGDYDEVEYIGDHTDQGNYVTWFDSRGLVDSVTLDLTHVVLQNTTGPSSQWGTECTSFRGTEVTLTWRFLSDDDGVNGQDGLAGFALDNITVREYTFTPVQSYQTTVTGLDSQDEQIVNVANHDFEAGIYRVDAMTIFDNQTMGTNWYGAEELFLSNNVSRVIFEVASVDLTLYIPDVLSCVDYAVKCAYPIDDVKKHSFSIGFKNGVLAGEFDVMLGITDVTTGTHIIDVKSDQSPHDLAEHELGNASWTAPYDGWIDGHEYNLSFTVRKTADQSNAGGQHSFHIVFRRNIDVAILSDTTDQSRLQSVRADIDALGMSYTQYGMDDWSAYTTQDWLAHYDKVLLPWQTPTNVENRQYYTALKTIRSTDNLALHDVLMNWANSGGTVQMHLGPYANHYSNPDRLMFGISVLDRNTPSTYIEYGNVRDVMVQDPYHPLMDNVDPVSFVGINSGNFVASAAIATTQTESHQIPSVCGGTPSAPYGTFQNILQGPDQSMSLLATCAYGQGGVIITTIDVENPSVSERHDSTTMPLLANLLQHQVTPYPTDFGIADDGWNMTINGKKLDFDSLTGNYMSNSQCKCHYMKSNAELNISFNTEISGLDADWQIRSGDSNPVSTSIADMSSGTAVWTNRSLDPGKSQHIEEDSFTGRFCVNDVISPTNCRIDAHWELTLFVHDSDGHMRKVGIHLKTNDVQADEHKPVAAFTVKDHPSSRDNMQYLGEHPDDTGKDYWQVRLKRTGDIIVQFSAENSSDADSTDGTPGIESYQWEVYFDWPYDATNPDDTAKSKTETSPDFSHQFRNITVDPAGYGLDIQIVLKVVDRAGRSSEETLMYFRVVPESFGDEPPNVEFTTPIDGATQSDEMVWINGSVLSGSENGNVQIEVALDPTHLNLSPAQKFTKDERGEYNSTNGLGNAQAFSMTLDISELYKEGEGVQQTIWIKITEGSGSSAYVIYKQIDINLVPGAASDPCVEDPTAAGCEGENQQSEDTEGVDTWVLAAGGGGALLLIVIILATLVVLRRGGESVAEEGFAGVESMDPMEAYVQQLIAQGYDEMTARAYAQQYAAHFQQQAAPGYQQ